MNNQISEFDPCGLLWTASFIGWTWKISDFKTDLFEMNIFLWGSRGTVTIVHSIGVSLSNVR